MLSRTNKIENIGDFLTNNLERIVGFDFKWHSLITNNPLLFEDIDYFRVKSCVDEEIISKEIEAYKTKNLRDMYATFDNMLMCNLKYYDRIMSYCTMVFYHYIKIDNVSYSKDLEKIPYMLSLTPTRIWCCALTSSRSTKWELEYAWNVKLTEPETEDKSYLETNWHILYKNPTFAKFIEYCAFRNGTKGFRETFIKDKTSNMKLNQVCSKFLNTTNAVSDIQLKGFYSYTKEIDKLKYNLHLVINKVLNTMYAGDESQYAVYIFTDEIFIHTSKFSLKIYKNNGSISKDYLANSYECFLAEEYLISTIKEQISWTKNTLPTKFNYDKKILKTLLSNMLKDDYRNTICVKQMILDDEDFGVTTKVTFKGIFSNVKIVEEFILNSRVIKTIEKVLSKQNAADYLIERGYYIFGSEESVHKLLYDTNLKAKDYLDHYRSYCVPVITHMFNVISENTKSKNEIIDFMVTDELNPNKIMNHTIKLTSLTKINTKDLMSEGLRRQTILLRETKKSYWNVIED